MTAMTSKTEFEQWLISVDACWNAREWAADRTAKEAWAQCERADWLLWWAAMAKVDRKVLVRCACQCARRALQYVPAGETRPLAAIETAEAWCEGKATIEQVRTAAYAAYATNATNAAYAAYATNAAYAATNAAYAAYAAADATNAAYAAYAAYANAANAAARDKEMKAMCAIVREMIPFPGTPQ